MRFSLPAQAQGAGVPSRSSVPAGRKLGVHKNDTILYRNLKYGFTFRLPKLWKGYSIVKSTWQGSSREKFDLTKGPTISIRNPRWTQEEPWQDIPIMVFTRHQWKMLQKDVFTASPAPYGPQELGRNHRYVFALPPRFTSGELTGFVEASQIMKGDPLRAF